MRLLKSLVAPLLLLVASSATAIPISFTHIGTGSGSIDGTVFTDQAFVISASADTDDRTAFGSLFGIAGFSIDHLSASISIGLLGRFDLLSGTRTFVNNQNNTIGFAHAGSFGGFDLFNGPSHSAFSSFDLLSSIGPISGSGNLVQWDSFPVNTTGGVLSFASATTVAQFSSQIGSVPEPTPLSLLALVLLGAGIYRRHKSPR